MNAVVFFAHEFFRTPDTKSISYSVVFVREQGEVEILLFDELAQAGNRVGADAQNHGVELVEGCLNRLGQRAGW